MLIITRVLRPVAPARTVSSAARTQFPSLQKKSLILSKVHELPSRADPLLACLVYRADAMPWRVALRTAVLSRRFMAFVIYKEFPQSLDPILDDERVLVNSRV